MDISLYQILYQCLVDRIRKPNRPYLAHGSDFALVCNRKRNIMSTITEMMTWQ